MIPISFDDVFELETIAQDLSFATFRTQVKDGYFVLLKIEIKTHPDLLLPDVYNLCFGPLDTMGQINDNARVDHQDNNRMFSTVLIVALMFLRENPEINIGLDGSNDGRAYLYHRMFQTNREMLNEYFDTIGVDWYVKLQRDTNIELDRNDAPYFKPRPEPFDYKRNARDLYRYYMFRLTQ